VNTDVLTDVPAPIGLGFRVPLLLISPWTRGRIVLSQALDHTSVLQFLEVRFNVSVPTISPWRRAMTGDLLHAFDFEHPDYSWPELPSTSAYQLKGDIECHTLPPPVVPAVQAMPTQEPGTRLSRSLPYEFQVQDAVTTTSTAAAAAAAAPSEVVATIAVSVQNTGEAGAPFVLYDVLNLAAVNPRQYAVEAGKSIRDVVSIPPGSGYHYALMGINGFVREFRGAYSCNSATMQATLSYQPAQDSVVLQLTNTDKENTVQFSVADMAYGLLSGAKGEGEVLLVSVPPGQTVQQAVSTAASGNWYDLTATVTVSAVGEEPPAECFYRRFMGRMETGKDTISDPAMGAGKPGLWTSGSPGSHPELPERVRRVQRLEGKHAVENKDSMFHTQLVEAL
jgi:phospholipase C